LDWRERWDCDHKGKKRDRKSVDVPPHKRRKSTPSIKVGCKAGLSAYKLIGQDAVYITWY